MPTDAVHRHARIDLLRGLALVWMTVFHACFDLQHFGYLQGDFYTDPFWTWQRSAIVSLFVFCAGLGQAMALQQGQDWSRFWRRWLQIAGCALLVSLGSWWMFPQSYIYFGILHGMAFMLVVTRLLAVQLRSRPAGWGLLAAIALGLPAVVAPLHARWPALDFLNERAWNWLGLISRKPVTQDYAPLFPWLGVMFLGLAAGNWLWRQAGVAPGVAGLLQPGMASPSLRALAWLGRHSLPYYMLHQPLLIGGLSALAWLR